MTSENTRELPDTVENAAATPGPEAASAAARGRLKPSAAKAKKKQAIPLH